MALKFDYNKVLNDYLNYFYEELEFALQNWEQEVKNNIMSDFIKKHGNPSVDSYVKFTKKAIIGYLEANPAVLADAYGTGSLMNIEDNPGFQEYRNSQYWNPARKNKNIVGRPEGNYVDIFGNKKYSWGTREGENLEYDRRNTGYQIEPIPPSNSIKNADNWLFNTYLPVAFRNAMQKMKFSKYIIEVNK